MGTYTKQAPTYMTTMTYILQIHISIVSIHVFTYVTLVNWHRLLAFYKIEEKKIKSPVNVHDFSFRFLSVKMAAIFIDYRAISYREREREKLTLLHHSYV